MDSASRKPMSRRDARRYAAYFRHAFKVPSTGAFPVLEALEKVPDLFPKSNYCILEDSYFPPNTMGRCFFNEDGGYTIEIRESVYRGAYETQNGAFLGFICHELCHVFLFSIGFTPVTERSFSDEKPIPAYLSVEWQAKALCGEVMIPYEESRTMTIKEMIEKYHVSKAFAEFRSKQKRWDKVR